MHNSAAVAVVTNALLYALYGSAIVPVDATTKSIALAVRQGHIGAVVSAAALVSAKRQFVKLPIAVRVLFVFFLSFAFVLLILCSTN